jgi:site-specific DNA-cytosine methylase
MRAAGYDVVWGIEKDARIADVARANGCNVITGDILEANPDEFAWVDYLHASPPCPNFSQAKTGAQETPEDIALAGAVCGFISSKNPRFFTLENVSKYQYSESFAEILRTLSRLGYMFRFQILNAADFAVPQTRRRLWLIASRDGFVPYLPQPIPWVGWYAAIADLVPTLPDSQFAPWQLERLPAMWRSSLLFPATGHADDGGGLPRYAEEPAQTLRAQRQGIARAFIVDGQNSRVDGSLTIRYENSPTFTVSASTGHRPANAPRAAVPGR